jgi:hypothetical protein
MLSPHWVPLPSPDVIYRLTDDGAVLVSPGAGELRVLNATGATIWQLMDGQRSVSELENELSRRFGITADQASADLQSFLQDLQRRKLITWSDPLARAGSA